MNYTITPQGILLQDGGSFDLPSTFDCGQCFRWKADDNGSYSGIFRHASVHLHRADNGVLIESCSEADLHTLWNSYFDLDTDYDAARNELAMRCPSLREAINSVNGLRLLRQDPWEALCSFIISQNNHIPRIKGIISRLCEGFGNALKDGYSFPSAEVIAELSPEALAPLRAGFRTKYILDAARKVASGEVELSALYDAPLDEARKELMKIKGVGIKVADCTLLYGLHRTEAFPVDVWMKKALADRFAEVRPDELGPYAGLAQQYIFHYTRLISHP